MELVETQRSPAEVDAKASPPAAADLAVAIASHNAETIGPVIEAAEAGLAQCFPGRIGLILVANLGSSDDTVVAARRAVRDPTRLVHLPPRPTAGRAGAGGSPSRESTLRLLFDSAAGHGVKALAVVDPDRGALEPEAIGRLLSPALDGAADFVAPYYARPRFAGAITSSILYPFTRALYGRRVRFAGGGDFACSARFQEFCRAQGSWGGDGSRILTDLWVVHRALTGGFRLSQAVIGTRTHAGTDGSTELSGVLARVLGELFAEAERNVPFWQRVRTSEPVPVVGTPVTAELEGPPVDLTKTVDAFRLGLEHLLPVWRNVLPPTALLELGKLARRSDNEFRLPDALWARIVYDFTIGFHARVMSREHLLSGFTPLYLGWLASHFAETSGSDPATSERRIEELCLRFESEKPYLISRWRWPDRFDP